MSYSEPVKWTEAEQQIREKMTDQPRGYQAKLAKKLETTPGYINQIITGHRPLPLEHLDVILESLGMEYDVILQDLR